MADKAISQLNPATAVTALDLFVLEQSGEAKKLTGQILENWLLSYADGHGGVQSFVKISSSGTNPVIDVWRMTYADETYTDIPVTNGVKGDQGDQTYVWIKYAAHYPTSDADMSSSPDDWIGIYSGTSSTAPIHYTDYTWYEFKGEKGDTGEAATIVTQTVGYQQSDSGSVVPEGSWTTTVPAPVQGKFLWTRMQLQFNTGSTITSYSVSRYGMDGSGSVVTVNNVSPDQNGNVQLVANDIQAADNQSIQTHLTDAETDIDELKTSISDVKSNVAFVEDGDTATHAVGKWRYVIWKGTLYISTQPISIGTTLSNNNLTAVNNGGLNALGAINDASLVEPSGIVTTITPTTGSNYSTYGGSYFYKVGTLVHVHIGVSGITANANNDIFTLPVGYRPYSQVGVAGNAGTSYTAHCHIAVLETGVIKVSSTDTYAIGDIEFHAFN